jgi:hypothetical protein
VNFARAACPPDFQPMIRLSLGCLPGILSPSSPQRDHSITKIKKAQYAFPEINDGAPDRAQKTILVMYISRRI